MSGPSVKTKGMYSYKRRVYPAAPTNLLLFGGGRGAGGGATARIANGTKVENRFCRKMELPTSGKENEFLLPGVGGEMTRQKFGLSRGTWNSGLSEAQEHMPRKSLDSPDRLRPVKRLYCCLSLRMNDITSALF